MEEFFKNYQYTFQALGAIATTFAVALSIIYSMQNRPKLRALLSGRTIMNLDLGLHGTFLCLNLINIGGASARVNASMFNWKIPFDSTWYNITMPVDFSGAPSLVGQKNYPCNIEPNSSENFVLSSMESANEEIIKMHINTNFLGRLFFCFSKGYVFTEAGQKFSVSLSKNVKLLFKKQ